MKSLKLNFIADFDDFLISEEVREEFIPERIESHKYSFKLSSLQAFSGEYKKNERLGAKQVVVAADLKHM